MMMYYCSHCPSVNSDHRRQQSVGRLLCVLNGFKMGDTMMFIPEIVKGLAHWTVRVTITEEMPTLVGFQRGTKYKRYVFTDDQGNTIPVVIYGSDIDVFKSALTLHGVYNVSNALVKDTTVNKDGTQYPKHWVMQRDTIVRPLPGELPNLRYFLDNVVSVGTLGDSLAGSADTVDIIGIIIKAEDSKSITTKFGEGTVQKFTLVDASRKPVSLSIWDQQVTHYGTLLTAAAASYSVVVAKRLKVKMYRGISLSSSNSSSFTIDVPLENVIALKSWFDSVREDELPNLLDDYSIAFAKDLVDRNVIKTMCVSEIHKSNQCGDYWTRASLQITPGAQKLYYIGCSNCSTKVSSKEGFAYYCLLCNKDVVASIRPRVSVDVVDVTGRVTAGAISTMAEDILLCDAAHMKAYVIEDAHFDLDNIRSRFEGKTFLMLLRRTYNKRSDAPKRLLLVAYFDESGSTSTTSAAKQPCDPDAVATSSCVPIVQSSNDIQSISPLKRQLESVTIETGKSAKKALFDSDDAPSLDVSGTGDPNIDVSTSSGHVECSSD